MRKLRLTWLFGDRRDAELHDELRAHLAMDQAERVARGESAREAAFAARRDFGNVALVHEVTRDMWSGAWLDRLGQDVRFGLRMLKRTPTVTAIAVACLSLGIGANAAVFSWIEGILFRPYPGVVAQDRLVAIAGTSVGRTGFDDMSWPDFEDLARDSSIFSALIATKIIGATLTGSDRADRVVGQLVSANFFDALGVRPILGRGFLPDEETGANAHPVTVISYRMWQDRFRGDPAVIGQTLNYNAVPHTIIGVAPPAFLGTFVGYAMQFWVPASMQAAFNARYLLDDRGARWIEGLARLRPGVTIQQAQAALTTAARRFAADFPDLDRGRGIQALPLWEAPFDNAKELLPTLRIAAVVVVFVLLIVCANVANLLLVRSFARRHEMTVRLALGAGRDRLVRQLLTEGVLLALLGTLVGLLVAYWCRHVLVLFFAPRGGIRLSFSSQFDWRVLALSATVGVTSTLVFALGPALRGSHVDLAGALKSDSRTATGGGGGGGGTRLRAGLVMMQVSTSFVLLVGAGLLLASLQRMRATSPGFTEDGVVSTTVNLFAAGYDTARSKVFARDLLDHVRTIGGVESAALARTPPFSAAAPYASTPIAADGYDTAPNEQPVANANTVTPGYFATLGIPMLRGRDFTWADEDTTAPVAIVSETMAATYWPNRDPVGRRLEARGRWMHVVGVVKDIKYESLIKPPRPLFYMPMWQSSSVVFELHVKTRNGAATIAPALIGAIHSLDPNLGTYEVISMREQVARSTATQRIAVTFLGVFGGLALLLAAIGLYGVMSYAVSQSTRELGVRLALGAAPRQVLRLVIGRGLVLTALGIVIGVATAFGVTRLLGDLLYKVSPRDPVAFASALVLMLATAVAACLVPAWRAARTDLMRALRA